MFYSHEILTSQRHGVATVWLVATLGHNSTSKKINRKTILNVDVRRACDTIMSPEAPMALRLQGNLLYGVTKVYSRQCVYTLADVQAMLNKMKTVLKVVHGRDLQADAGKAKPEELIVPYDPAFIPDFTFPSIDLELLNPLQSVAPSKSKLDSSLLSSNMSNSSHSQLELITFPQLDVDASNTILAEFGGFSFASGNAHSPVNHNLFERLDLGGEEQGLLQPDFDFDEDGNIVDLVMTGAAAMPPATPVRSRVSHNDINDILQGPQDLDIMVTTPVMNALNDVQSDAQDHQQPSPTWGRLPDPDYVDDTTGENVVSNRKHRSPNTIKLDIVTQISRDELLQWDRDYLDIMSRLNVQRANAKGQSQARKNAASWVAGHGIGSVGMSIGNHGFAHPWESFCGASLLATLSDEPLISEKPRKRSSSLEEDDEGHARNVRRRLSDDGVEVGLTRPYEVRMQEDVELGLNAPPSLPDDASSQMPWNTTASLQGSLAGSSSVPRPFDGFDLSSRRYDRGLGRPSSRFSSASPLARRGLPRDLFGHDSLSSLSLRDFGDFHDDDLGDLLHGAGSDGFAEPNDNAFESQITLASLDNNDRNFLNFLQICVQNTKVGKGSPGIKKIAFSDLLPATSTSRAVATQALLHVLTLATKDVIQVSQGKRCKRAPYIIEDLDEIRLSIRD